MGFLTDPVGSARSAASELVNACKALPDFDTLQITHFPFIAPLPECLCGCRDVSYTEIQESLVGVKAVKDSVIDCLRLKAGCQEGEGRKKITLRIIELGSERGSPFCLSSVKVEEYGV